MGTEAFRMPESYQIVNLNHFHSKNFEYLEIIFKNKTIPKFTGQKDNFSLRQHRTKYFDKKIELKFQDQIEIDML